MSVFSLSGLVLKCHFIERDKMYVKSINIFQKRFLIRKKLEKMVVCIVVILPIVQGKYIIVSLLATKMKIAIGNGLNN